MTIYPDISYDEHNAKMAELNLWLLRRRLQGHVLPARQPDWYRYPAFYTRSRHDLSKPYRVKVVTFEYCSDDEHRYCHCGDGDGISGRQQTSTSGILLDFHVQGASDTLSLRLGDEGEVRLVEIEKASRFFEWQNRCGFRLNHINVNNGTGWLDIMFD